MKLLVSTFFVILLTSDLCLLLPPANADQIRLCGKKLILVLSKLCNHRYMTPSRVGGNRSENKGIAYHCCTNRCSYTYLRSFCAPEVTTTTPDTPLSSMGNRPNKTFPSMLHLLHEVFQIWSRRQIEEEKNLQGKKSN
uniref:Insulin-like domain-containing protein n=1 Tax=Plectus sambesii TaxID=2011161 RepID=A0A914XKC0_9BILA